MLYVTLSPRSSRECTDVRSRRPETPRVINFLSLQMRAYGGCAECSSPRAVIRAVRARPLFRIALSIRPLGVGQHHAMRCHGIMSRTETEQPGDACSTARSVACLQIV